MLRRGIVLRCPWCASRRTFIHRWLGRRDRCQTCGIRWRREAGFELGPMTLNIAVTFLAVIAGLAVGLILTAPEIAVLPIVAALVVIAVVVPVVAFPFTFTVWLAVDLAARRPGVVELAEAATAVAAGEAAPVAAPPADGA
jgi:uncharacterized protein (DUF983 family)